MTQKKPSNSNLEYMRAIGKAERIRSKPKREAEIKKVKEQYPEQVTFMDNLGKGLKPMLDVILISSESGELSKKGDQLFDMWTRGEISKEQHTEAMIKLADQIIIERKPREACKIISQIRSIAYAYADPEYDRRYKQDVIIDLFSVIHQLANNASKELHEYMDAKKQPDGQPLS